MVIHGYFSKCTNLNENSERMDPQTKVTKGKDV